MEEVRRKRVDTHAAHECVEFAKGRCDHERLVENIYYAFWRHGDDISDVEVLTRLAKNIVPDISEMLQAIEAKRFAAQIKPFQAHDRGVYNVPTFWIGGKPYAEQPWTVLRSALGAAADEAPFYQAIAMPRGTADRPYLFINMVATIDGKIITGDRGEPVEDLGSRTDHLMMRRIQSATDAVLIGAGAQRSSANIWYPRNLQRFVATRSGKVLAESRFFTDAPEMAGIICPNSAKLPELPEGVRIMRSGETKVDWTDVLRRLVDEFGVHRLLCEGGSDINAQLLEEELADELFLTLAPKIKLGKDVPTYADGDPLPRELVQKYELLESHRWRDEMFLRYRRLR
jgi:riboflavin biosynthesis pyrimidine reductase